MVSVIKTTFFLIIFIAMGNLQPASAGKISAKGLKVGVNVTDFYGTDIEDEQESSRTGFAVGGFLTYQISPLLAAQPELFISLKGADEINNYITPLEAYRVYYLEVPLLIKMTVPTNTAASPNMFIGPSLAMRIKAEKEVGDILVAQPDVRPLDVGITLGMGLDYNLDYRKLLFEIRYNLGLQSIDDSEKKRDWKNRVIAIMFGYGF